jgi:hypothetical protein
MPLRLLRRRGKDTQPKQLTQQQRASNTSPPIRRHPFPHNQIASNYRLENLKKHQ